MNGVSWLVVLTLLFGGLAVCVWLYQKSPGLLMAGIVGLCFIGSLIGGILNY
tara:strand:+ start:705 stop:860 length:156 start_codon:yes stop_codon:yes gene_type:complete